MLEVGSRKVIAIGKGMMWLEGKENNVHSFW